MSKSEVNKVSATDIKTQFNLVSQIYDKSRKIFIPCYEDFYIGTTNFIAGCISPSNIVDLGAGTGLLSMYYYEHFPECSYLLVDIADKMFNIARDRFKGAHNVNCLVQDYSEQYDFDADTVISALSIHHLEDDAKKKLFHNIYRNLPSGGVFVNYDQFCGEDAVMTSNLDKYWYHHLMNSSLTSEEIEKWKSRRVLDRECSVKNEIAFLRAAGFESVECVYRMQKFAVIVSRKSKQ